jgi:hypothetical protein
MDRRLVLKGGAAGALIFAGGCAMSLDSLAATRGGDIWYGPMSLQRDHSVKPTFVSEVANPSEWPYDRAHIAVFKQFIESLIPSDKPYHLHMADMQQLAAALKQLGVACAFEVGGTRLTGTNFGPGSGAKSAQDEIRLLKMWEEAGGTVDYLTTDHAMMNQVEVKLKGKPPFDKPGVNLGLNDFIWEAVNAHHAFHLAFPNAKLGIIESLGYFRVGPFRATSPDLPDMVFDEVIGAFMNNARSTGTPIDHYHIDYDLQGVTFDGHGTPNYGRVLMGTQIARAHGLRVGLIVTGWDDRSRNGQPVTDVQAASAQAAQETLAYLKGYLAAGGHPDTWVVERWEPYPQQLGPESNPDTDMGILRSVLRLIS